MDDLKYLEELLNFVSKYIVKQYVNRKNLHVSTKKHANDLLTEVDVNVQKLIVEKIKKQFPNDLIIGEESGLDSISYTKKERCWIIDPIDGTQNFVRGLFPEFGVSIGLTINGIPEVGGIIFPVSDDIFLAERNKGAFQNGKKIRVSETSSLTNSRIDFDLGPLNERQKISEKIQYLLLNAGQVRSYGCAVMGFCQVANGEQDAYIACTLNPWDAAAGMLLVQEAGGKISSFKQEIDSPFKSKDIRIISNSNIHNLCKEK